MRFMVDESADSRLIPYLTDLGHDAIFVAYSYGQGIPDDVHATAYAEGRILITHDRDFGDLVFILDLALLRLLLEGKD